MVSHHPTEFIGNGQCGSGDIMFSVVEEQDSACSRLNLPLLFISV